MKKFAAAAVRRRGPAVYSIARGGQNSMYNVKDLKNLLIMVNIYHISILIENEIRYSSTGTNFANCLI